MKQILKEIESEIIRQNEKWGVQNHKPIEWLAILMEEVGEASKEALDHHFNYPPPSDWIGPAADLPKERMRQYRKEIIQTAAVAVQMISSLDRNENSL